MEDHDKNLNTGSISSTDDLCYTQMAKRLRAKAVRADEGFEKDQFARMRMAKPAGPKRTNTLGHWSTYANLLREGSDRSLSSGILNIQALPVHSSRRVRWH